jgi:hypothetical protein
MTKSDMVDNLDGVLSDISYLIETVPSEEAHMILVRMKLTLAKIADALESGEADDSE